MAESVSSQMKLTIVRNHNKINQFLYRHFNHHLTGNLNVSFGPNGQRDMNMKPKIATFP